MKILDMYTDGSHFKLTTGRLGIGGVLVDLSQPGPLGKILGKFNKELDPKILKKDFGPGAENCSNPTAELTAVLVGLREFKNLLKDADMINVHADYIGVREWMTGKWRTKEPYIAKLKDAIEKELIEQGILGRINYMWVKGHQAYVSGDPDIHYNSMVDLLAKGENV